jgi:hypothetical protein
MQEKVAYYNSLARDSYAILRDPSFAFLAVFFTGVNADTILSVQDLNWIASIGCIQYEQLGFGFPAQGKPVLMIGTLTKGQFRSIEADSVVVALIFLVPKDTTSVTLVGPDGSEVGMDITSAWQPGPENDVTGFSLSDDGFIKQTLEGDSWCATFFKPCP